MWLHGCELLDSSSAEVIFLPVFMGVCLVSSLVVGFRQETKQREGERIVQLNDKRSCGWHVSMPAGAKNIKTQLEFLWIKALGKVDQLPA